MTRRTAWIWLLAIAGCGSDESGGDAAVDLTVAATGDLAKPADAAKASDAAAAAIDQSVPGDLAVVAADMAGAPAEAVIERNNSPARTGLYVQPALTKAAAAKMARDNTFDGTVAGNVYAQPLYVSDGPNGQGVFIVVTESNNVVALDETTGKPVWMQNLGAAPNDSGAGCGNIHPLGVTGTPYLDPAGRTIYLDAVLGTGMGNGSIISTHRAHALSLDDGSERQGWPVDLKGVKSGNLTFNPVPQNERGSIAFLGGTVYIPFGGHAGDCGPYHGWVIGVPVANPGAPVGFATGSGESGIWAPGGVASDGTHLFAATGNGNTNNWQQQEAILRFSPGPVFSGNAADYWAAPNWQQLDNGDVDIGGTAPMLVDVPNSTPGKLVLAMGKDGNVYLIDRTNLGGIVNAPVKYKAVNGAIINAPATVTTVNGVFVYLHGHNGAQGASCPNGGGDLVALKLAPGNPPTVTTAWCANNGGQGSPMVTTTDGKSEAIVWTTGAEGSNRLHGFDAETGQVVFAGGGNGDAMTGLRRFSTPIAVKGRIAAAADNKLYIFKSQ